MTNNNDSTQKEDLHMDSTMDRLDKDTSIESVLNIGKNNDTHISYNEIIQILNKLIKDRINFENSIEELKKYNARHLENVKDEYRKSIIKLNTASDNFITETSKQQSDVDKKISDALEHINQLDKQAKSILQESSTGAMSSSFLKEKELHSYNVKFLSIIFILFICLIICIPFLLYYFNILAPIAEWKEDPILIIFSIIKVLAFEWPLIWVANLLSRRIQIQERICEEYTFKYSVMLSYTILRNEIKVMNSNVSDLSENQELKIFTEKMANAMFINPSTFFNKKIDSYSPINELTELLHKILQGNSQPQDTTSQIKK